MFNTPILLISWKRPEKTKRLLEAIRKIEPKKLYLACDGAKNRDNATQAKVHMNREILNQEINWDCEVKKLYSEINHGCKIGVSKAINWFFENEKEGIILEDDCIPHKDFFYFCKDMLARFRSDERIWCISAHNLQNGEIHGDGSYYFSRYSHCWGWATWKRCWDLYDPNIEQWPIIKKNNTLKQILDNKKQIKYWEKIFDNLFNHSFPDTWDYQWTFTCLINSGLTVIPNINLIENIGFDEEATHTIEGRAYTDNHELNQKESGLYPLRHPKLLVRSKYADINVENVCYSGYPINSLKGLIFNFKKINRKIKTILNL